MSGRDVERLVHEGLAIAESVARKMFQRLGGTMSMEDLLSAGRAALADALREHDPARTPFEPYLIQRLQWAMLDEARRARRSRTIRTRATAVAALERLAEDTAAQVTAGDPLRSEEEYQADLRQLLAQRAAAMALSLVSLPDTERHPDAQETPEDKLAREQLHHDMKRAIETLPDRQRALVERHYFAEERFEAIAEDLGVSKSWASRLHAQAMDRLAVLLRGRV